MSFVKTLATLAAGFAAARGYDKFRKMGGMDALQDKLRNANAPGGMADQLGQMAEKMGIPGGAKAVKDMVGTYAPQAAEASESAQAGFGSVLASMQGAFASGSAKMSEMMESLTKGTPAGAAAEESARLMIRAMIQAAKADGEIDADERAKIMEHLKNASAEELAYVEQQMDAPADLAGLATATGETMKAQVYSTSLMAMKPDSDREKTYLRQLADALGLDAATRDRIHEGMGLPPLG